MLSDSDKERARYHLGYMEVVVASSMAFGIPQVTDTQWMFESAITRVMTGAEARVIRYLDQLDCIEQLMMNASTELFAKRIEGLEPNLGQPDDLEKEYVRWACRLADMLGIMPYPYSARFQVLRNGGGTAGNVSVRR